MIGGHCELASDFRFARLSSLASAAPGDLSFLHTARYREQARTTRASAVLVRAAHRDLVSPESHAWIVDDPYLAYAHASAFWERPEDAWWNTSARSPRQGVVPWNDVAIGQAVVLGEGVALGRGVVLGDGVELGPGVILGDGVRLGEGVSIAPGCSLGPRTSIGSGSRIGPGTHVGPEVVLGCRADVRAGVVIERACRIGDRVRIQAHAVIGADGFGFARTAEGRWVKIVQLGAVVVGDDVEIGALCSIDRGALDDTRIGRGSKLDNQIQVGHNVSIGEDCILAGCVGIAGSTVLGKRIMVGGGAGILGHLRIADDVVIAAMSLISRSIDGPGFYGASYPQMSNAEWERSAAVVKHLPQMRRRLMRLEAAAQWSGVSTNPPHTDRDGEEGCKRD